MGTYYLMVTKVMILMDKAVENLLLRGKTNHFKFKGKDALKIAFNRVQRKFQLHTLRGAIPSSYLELRGRKLDNTFPVKAKKKITARHILQRTICLAPIPHLTYITGYIRAAFLPMQINCFLKKRYL
jgi:hypothetical protein